MLKRLLVLSVIASSFAVGGASPALACEGGLEVATANEAHATFGGVSISMWEDTPAVACADGVSQPDPYRRLLISVGDEVVCDRSDVDPSFDPFLFGAGLRTIDPEDSCGVSVSMSSIDRPITPVVPGLDGTKVTAHVHRSTPAEGGVWYTDATGTRVELVDQVDVNAYTLRGASAAAI